MRAAVISDIHANLPAFEAVLEAIDADAVEEVWCLGDVVGYGAEPDACAALVQKHAAVCLAGNHDLAVSGAVDIGTFSPDAAAAARWTIGVIGDNTRSFLEGLEPSGRRKDFGLYHGSPRDPIWEYVLSFDEAEASLGLQDERVSLIGHSHVACWFTGGEQDTYGEQALADQTVDASAERWLLNPGSVGQPRDGDPRAAYLVLDTVACKASYRRVEYPIEHAAQAITDAGLPDQLAGRLFTGQ